MSSFEDSSRATSWVLCLLLASVGCGRGPGPHDSEIGKLQWWLRVGGGGPRVEGCAVSGPHRSYARTDEMPYTPGLRWYVNYELEPGGVTAVSYDCNEENWTDCVLRSDIVWTVEGHDVHIERAPQPTDLGSDDCRVDAILRATLHDKGKQATFSEEVRFILVGETTACDRVEASFRGETPDGPGLRACVFAYDYPFVYSHLTDRR